MTHLALFFALASSSRATCNAHPHYRLKAVVQTSAPVRDAGKQYRETARVRFVVIGLAHPLVPPANVPLRIHAEGHRQIAETYARGAGAVTVQGVGATPALAKRAVQREITRVSTESNAELQRQETLYDRVTENGAAQDQAPLYHFPTGPDVTTFCH